MKINISLIALLLAIHAPALAQLRLPNVLSSNMVLQRNTSVNFWGWGYASSTVNVKASWLKDTVKTQVDASGRWRISLVTGPAGGPYNISVASGDDEFLLINVLLGDVWLCSGQSNMELGAKQQVPEMLEELPRADDSNIRLLNVTKSAADHPQYDIPDSWETLDSNSLYDFSAIGYFVAKRLRNELNVPIGIINASWGGTPGEVWTPSYLIDNDTRLRSAAAKQKPTLWWPHEPGVTWNTMIFPLTSYTLSGFFWYQGESNVGWWQDYDRLMRAMITSWRLAWDAELPFYFVQIAPFTYNNEQPKAALLREQQTMTVKSVSNAGMVVTTDLIDNIDDIHPMLKRAVADRLATLALSEHYRVGEETDYKSPIYSRAEIRKDTMVIAFDYLEKGLKSKGNEIRDLYICGADSVFHDARCIIKGNELHVFSPLVSSPVAVRFGFSESAMPNLFNSNWLPVSPFRTDEWPFD